jgi:hypothetical protein
LKRAFLKWFCPNLLHAYAGEEAVQTEQQSGKFGTVGGCVDSDTEPVVHKADGVLDVDRHGGRGLVRAADAVLPAQVGLQPTGPGSIPEGKFGMHMSYATFFFSLFVILALLNDRPFVFGT